MLQDDRHLLGIFRAHALGYLHPGRAGIEGDEEMMIAGQAVLGGVGQNLFDDAAQRVLGQEIVADEIRHLRQ